MKKIIKRTIYILIGLIILVVVVFFINTRERHSDYTIDLQIQSNLSDTILSVGLAKSNITPQIIDTWTDIDGNAKYEPDKGDTYQDNNGNGVFDAYWIAGFGQKRAANGVHDDIWARAILFEKDNLRIAYVALDAIGFFYDDVIDIRKEIAAKSWDIDHVIVSSTHNHEVPDLMGLWGGNWYKSGVNEKYMQFVKDQSVNAIEKAVKALRPAIIKVGKLDSTAKDLVHDSRKPIILDDAVHMMQFIDAETSEPLGMLVNWGNHPETAGSDNLMITADFPHYMLEGLEKGIIYNDVVKEKGFGGIAVYANGAVGGLMTSLRDHIHNPWTGKTVEKDGLEKVEAQGHRLAKLMLDHIKTGEWEIIENPRMELLAKTFIFEVDNKIFMLAGALKVLNRGFKGINDTRSEVNLLQIGSVQILFIPGEIYPEIVNGGVESPENADFHGDPIETPPLRQLMQGKYKFVIGLANDEVGYMLPKTQWDSEEPFSYDYKKAPYGEVNSLGPETGSTIYKEAVRLINKLKE